MRSTAHHFIEFDDFDDSFLFYGLFLPAYFFLVSFFAAMGKNSADLRDERETEMSNGCRNGIIIWFLGKLGREQKSSFLRLCLCRS